MYWLNFHLPYLIKKNNKLKKKANVFFSEISGYFSDTKSTIVVIAACYLPEKTIKNYDFLMEQLFL